ncbi:MAG: ATP-dependent DNA helicase RecG [Elusimicrobiota bacterium]
MDIQYLKGVGPGRAKLLKKVGVETVEDLLAYYPRDWEDRSQLLSIKQTAVGKIYTLKVKVEATEIKEVSRGLRLFKALFSDPSGYIYGIWFKQGSPRYDVFYRLKKEIAPGQKIIVYGEVDWGGGQKQIRVHEYELLQSSNDELIHTGRIVPLYSLTEGLDGRWLRGLINRTLEQHKQELKEFLPASLINRYSLLGYPLAAEKIHFPKDGGEKEEAYRRLAFQEFFLLELALAKKRQEIVSRVKKHHYQIHRHLLTPFREKLGFEFTSAQKTAIREIFNDLSSPHPMNRLLQGDVGSGKTVVALSACLLAAENGYQSALMVPTEILAEQHFINISRMLKGLPVKVELLIGATSRKDRKRILEEIAEGQVQIVVGTQALIQDKIDFHSLTFCVIDEQHRFGVEQRAALQEKAEKLGFSPDILVMTATPIPRTLTLTVYGDLDVSVLNELPPGRKKIVTRKVPAAEAYQFVRSEAGRGRQIYIVYPLVEESDKLELKAAVEQAEKLKEKVFPDLSVGLLHGQMKSKEKEKIMAEFKEGKYAVLITTTVIEVGIDVANATVMVIEEAQRFGLATLHQLRGRVGRGAEASYCLLLGEAGTEEAQKRFQVMIETNDGFRIAEEDLALRGPGEMFGTLQHGQLELKIGNIFRDFSLLQEARTAAFELLKNDPHLLSAENQLLGEHFKQKFGQRLKLVEVG